MINLARKHLYYLIFSIILLSLINPFSAQTIQRDDSYYQNFTNELKNSNKKIDLFENGINTRKYFCVAITRSNISSFPLRSEENALGNLINDLLRLNISVYFSLSNITATSIHVQSETHVNQFFPMGTVLIPLTGKYSKDVLLTTVISNYVNSKGLIHSTPIDLYCILNPISVLTLPLNQADIAYYFGDYVSQMSLIYYIETLIESGFFDFQILSDSTLPKQLDNKNVNLLIWPGANLGLSQLRYTKTILNREINKKIDTFIHQGGGYIGSCFGSELVTSGPILPFTLCGSKQKYVPFIGFLSLIPSSFFSLGYGGHNTIIFEKPDHPLFFGCANKTTTFHASSFVFPWVQNKNDILARLTNYSIAWYNPLIPGVSTDLLDNYFQKCLHSPIWLNKTYGKGKIIAFGDHPEFYLDNTNTKILHNAVYFTTSKLKTNLSILSHRPLSFFYNICSLHNDIVNYSTNNSDNHFPVIKTMTKQLHHECKKIDQFQTKLFVLSKRLSDDGKISAQTSTLLENPFYDSFERWITRFSDSIDLLNRIIDIPELAEKNQDTICNYKRQITKNISILLENIDYLQAISTNLSKESYLFQSISINDKIRNYKTEKQLEQLLKSTYTKLIQLFPETIQLAKTIWYQYEKNMVFQQLKRIRTPLQNQIHHEKKNVYDQSIIYVNHKYIGGNGSKNAPLHSIRDAIDIAKTNDTILVFPGIYKEKLLITKPLQLLGVNKNNTIIDGQKIPQHTVFVTADYVTIKGFTIRNSSIKRYSCGICVYSSRNTISNNIFTQNCVGFGMGQSASHNIISNNQFFNNSYIGAGVDNILQYGNFFSHNTFYDNDWFGLYLINTKVYVENNTFINDGITVFCNQESLHIQFKNNTINSLPFYCIKNETSVNLKNKPIGGLILINCSFVNLNNINFSQTDSAIQIINCDTISISHCYFNKALKGINSFFSKQITISNCTFSNSLDTSVSFTSCVDCIVKNCFIKSNTVGIFLHSSFESRIQDNTFRENDVGLSFLSKDCSKRVKQNNIFENVFLNNTQHAYAIGKNRWYSNYFDDWIGLTSSCFQKIPYFIDGNLIKNIDRNPATIHSTNLDWF